MFITSNYEITFFHINMLVLNDLIDQIIENKCLIDENRLNKAKTKC